MGPLLVYYVFNTHLLPLGCLALRTPTPPVTHKLGPEAEALQVPGNILRDPRKESRMERDWSSDVRVVWSQQLLHTYGSVSVCVGGNPLSACPRAESPACHRGEVDADQPA